MNDENNKVDFSIDASIFRDNYPLGITINALDPYDVVKIAELEKTISHYREIILRRCPEELI
jgi:hypothetical protein